MSGRSAVIPLMRACPWLGQKRSTSQAMSTEDLGRPRKRRAHRRRFCTPFCDCFDVDVEDDATELLCQTAVPGEGHSTGNRRFPPPARVRVSGSQKFQRERRARAARGVVLEKAEACDVVAFLSTPWEASWLQFTAWRHACPRCYREKKTATLQSPPDHFLLIKFQSFLLLSSLIFPPLTISKVVEIWHKILIC